MSPLVKALERLNRKERFWLLANAVGQKIPDNVTQRIDLSQSFIENLEKTILNIKIPKNAWWALDYHLDWLFAVLKFAPEYQLTCDRRYKNEVGDHGDRYISGTQEDCDLIIAFDSTHSTRRGWIRR